MPTAYDALLLLSFGGPEGPDEVLPFLENVLRGRNVPRERMMEVAEHYQHFGGVSPINAQNRELIAALRAELDRRGSSLPIYWGNRNWRPFLADTLREMKQAGVRRALALFTSPYSSYSSCRQYRENIAQAQEEAGAADVRVEKLRVYFNHPGFIEPMVESLKDALQNLPADRRADARVLFTAHSIPLSMAENCRYEEQLQEASRLVADGANVSRWRLVYQSRSGPPSQPWLEPDVGDVLAELADQGESAVVLVPIGFISDHMEVMYDLDVEARDLADQRGLTLVRARTVGCHPRFVQMICELIEERMSDSPTRLALGRLGPGQDVCPADCCLYDPRPPSGAQRRM
ncbi:MAG: ferrochelatase [Planctomycetes bacterium]|nr:ferrochelatase [Planctomycetota bacterium]